MSWHLEKAPLEYAGRITRPSRGATLQVCRALYVVASDSAKQISLRPAVPRWSCPVPMETVLKWVAMQPPLFYCN